MMFQLYRPRRLAVVLLLPLIAVWIITTENEHHNNRHYSSPTMFFVQAVSPSADFISTREEILASRERRMKQIELLLDDSQQRMNDHKSGIRLLNEKEMNDLQKKIDIYSRKLDSMKAPLDEREVQRIIQREEIRNELVNERRKSHREL